MPGKCIPVVSRVLSHHSEKANDGSERLSGLSAGETSKKPKISNFYKGFKLSLKRFKRLASLGGETDHKTEKHLIYSKLAGMIHMLAAANYIGPDNDSLAQKIHQLCTKINHNDPAAQISRTDLKDLWSELEKSSDDSKKVLDDPLQFVLNRLNTETSDTGGAIQLLEMDLELGEDTKSKMKEMVDETPSERFIFRISGGGNIPSAFTTEDGTRYELVALSAIGHNDDGCVADIAKKTENNWGHVLWRPTQETHHEQDNTTFDINEWLVNKDRSGFTVYGDSLQEGSSSDENEAEDALGAKNDNNTSGTQEKNPRNLDAIYKKIQEVAYD